MTLAVERIGAFTERSYSGISGRDRDATLTRRLARLAVDIALEGGANHPWVSVEVCDGRGDRGIDAVAIDDNRELIVLVQAKWSHDGRKTFSEGSASKFCTGVRELIGMGSSRIGESNLLPTCTPTMRASAQALLRKPRGRILLVAATTGAGPIPKDALRPILALTEAVNGGVFDTADYRILDQAGLLLGIQELARPRVSSVDLELELRDWAVVPDNERPGVIGRASALEIAKWFVDRRESLFTENVRIGLPSSEVNDGILRTIADDPSSFWYVNNGITLVAQALVRGVAGVAGDSPLRLSLESASVVNGAQTVTTLGRALELGMHDQLSKAFVGVKSLQVPADEPGLVRRITRYANTQNSIQPIDFAFLDAQQHRLVAELAALGYEYRLRATEPLNVDIEHSIDVRRAAVALACSLTLRHTIQAKREISSLFADEALYADLFTDEVTGLRVARLVACLNEIDAGLTSARLRSEPFVDVVATHANRLIAHALLRDCPLDLSTVDEASYVAYRSTLAARATALLDRIVAAFPRDVYPGNLLKNFARSAELLASVGIELSDEEIRPSERKEDRLRLF